MNEAAPRRRLCGVLAAAVLCFACPTTVAAAEPPSLGTVWVSEAAPESATANTFIDPKGLTTAWHFEYLSDAAFAANLAAGREGFFAAAIAPMPGQAAPITTAQIVSWPLSGLTQSTAYHLRAVASSSAGTVASLAPPLFFTTSTAIPCEGDACQPLPSAPDDPSPGTQVPTLGNPRVRFPKQHAQKHHKHHHKRKHHHKHKKRHDHDGRRR